MRRDPGSGERSSFHEIARRVDTFLPERAIDSAPRASGERIAPRPGEGQAAPVLSGLHRNLARLWSGLLVPAWLARWGSGLRLPRSIARRWAMLRLLRPFDRRWAYRAARSVVLSLDEHGAVRAASAIAFDAFLSLIPLVAFAGYVLSQLRQSSTLVLEPLIQAAPPAVAGAVEAEFIRMSQFKAVAPISLTGFLWMSSAGVSTAMGVFETMYAANERPWYVRRAIAAGCVLASLAIIPIAAGAGVLLGALSGSIGGRLIALLLPGALLVLLVAAFFRIAIRQPDVERRRALPGAITTVVLWALASALFSLYVATLARYATFYGSLATTAIFLLWLWMLALGLLVGGEVNARLERERLGMTSLPPKPRSIPPAPRSIPRAPALPAELADAGPESVARPELEGAWGGSNLGDGELELGKAALELGDAEQEAGEQGGTARFGGGD
jgi:membrane protein